MHECILSLPGYSGLKWVTGHFSSFSHTNHASMYLVTLGLKHFVGRIYLEIVMIAAHLSDLEIIQFGD